ncbi:hypothetical protein [Streptomyces acidiscabies]|uniref:Uncharacterized protein n=1 Tax=Streptomyces acidiscabies TaxID=42234 RepID=A0ABU4LX28_9ACTN|nr:hypothetical protein [Streptomyces acidiscabies]MDX3020116.1 hypothetical protein [Streptomyces acidiscabies]
MTKPTNPYAQAYADFLSETAGHQLVVLHDDGLYRHLRIQKPGTRMWSWDITTWPGHLATSGDIADGYMFAREPDMIQFFARNDSQNSYYCDGAPSIDVRYWAGKLNGGRSREVKKYDDEKFIRHVKDSLGEHEELGDEAHRFHEQQLALLRKLHELRGQDEAAMQEHLQAYRKNELSEAELWADDALSDEQLEKLDAEFDWSELTDAPLTERSPAERAAEILDEARLHSGSEQEAREWLYENSETFGEDTWEWDLRDYNIHFLFTCYCIELAVRLYHEYQAQQAALPESTRLSSRVFGFLVRGFRALGRPRRPGSHPTTEAVQP